MVLKKIAVIIAKIEFKGYKKQPALLVSAIASQRYPAPPKAAKVPLSARTKSTKRRIFVFWFAILGAFVESHRTGWIAIRRYQLINLA